MKRKKLVIISHTAHFHKDGTVVGWGPTVNEINYLSDYWDEIFHVACLYDAQAPPSSKPYTNGNIEFVAVRPAGGNGFRNKLAILFNVLAVLSKVFRSLRGATDVQFRAPTNMGVYILPTFSFIFKRRFNFWVKYAGNWNQEKPPSSYRLQRWWLKKNLAKCKVTINGFWSDQPAHCLSFENPCLTDEDISTGKSVQAQKKFNAPFRLAFVGRLEDEKGVGAIIEALRNLDSDLIECIDFIGDGAKRKEYEAKCAFMGEKVTFRGFLDNTSVHKFLSEAHFFLLPSNSEGFPKVIAEAACYGCIPVVSSVGSISHYVTDENNGFLWRLDEQTSFTLVLQKALSAPSKELEQKSKNILQLAEKFTFENYRRKLEKSILTL